MIRALTKGAGLFAFAHMPHGPTLYRTLTREYLGTYATHVDKLARVWPGYLRVFTERAGIVLEGAHVAVFSPGETPYAPLALALLTGTAGVMLYPEGRLLDRYLSRAVTGVLATPFDLRLDDPRVRERRQRIDALRWEHSAESAVRSLGAELHGHVDPTHLPLASDSLDLCHSGGELEHLEPAALAAFLRECFRVLRPGGVASHVVDHRDHLHHADRRLPFLAHLSLSSTVYRALCGHELGYHNRLAPTQLCALFESAGFERVAVRRMRYPERAYVEDDTILAGDLGIARSMLAREFAQISDADLRTAATHYVYAKPAHRARVAATEPR